MTSYSKLDDDMEDYYNTHCIRWISYEVIFLMDCSVCKNTEKRYRIGWLPRDRSIMPFISLFFSSKKKIFLNKKITFSFFKIAYRIL